MKSPYSILASNDNVSRLLSSEPDANGYGAFVVKHNGNTLRVVARRCSSGGCSDSVSVALADRYPDGSEMDYIKRLFFDDGDNVMEFHVGGEDNARQSVLLCLTSELGL